MPHEYILESPYQALPMCTQKINSGTTIVPKYHLNKQGCGIDQILLLVQGQVNGKNPLVQPRPTCFKIDIFSYLPWKCILWVFIRSPSVTFRKHAYSNI